MKEQLRNYGATTILQQADQQLTQSEFNKMNGIFQLNITRM